MNLKQIALIAGICAALGYGIGRYLQPVEVKTVTKVEKVVETQQVVHTVTKVVERPDGSKETEIVQDKDTNSHSDTTKDKVVDVTNSKSYSNFSLLAGVQPKLFDGTATGPITFGASWQTQPIKLIPLTVGLWAITTPAVGVSVGWNY